MRSATVIIIGAGQSGLAMSWHLTRHGIDHVILERGEVANAWTAERWDSLRLLTPNWQSRLPGYAYAGSDAHGYMSMPETARYLQGYAQASGAPVLTGHAVMRVAQRHSGYEVNTSQGPWRCSAVVLASGAASAAAVPAMSSELPASVASITPLTYRNPGQLPDGGVLVVGASASGIQIARELQAHGRRTILSVGEHVRMPRTYRGRDIMWWMDAAGLMDARAEDVDDLRRAQHLPSPQLIGTAARLTVDLNSLSQMGVELAGRFAGVMSGKAQFSGSLANVCALADLKLGRLLNTIDAWASASGVADGLPAGERLEPTRVPSHPRLSLDLVREGITTVVWATGYRPDYSWLHVPVFDRKGRLRHSGGIVDAPGMYVLGLPFMRRRKSSFIDGAGADAAELALHLRQRLAQAA
jgi:putative flavoprotein involved in K+ transport